MSEHFKQGLRKRCPIAEIVTQKAQSADDLTVFGQQNLNVTMTTASIFIAQHNITYISMVYRYNINLIVYIHHLYTCREIPKLTRQQHLFIYCKSGNCSDLTIIAVIVTSDLTIIATTIATGTKNNAIQVVAICSIALYVIRCKPKYFRGQNMMAFAQISSIFFIITARIFSDFLPACK